MLQISTKTEPENIETGDFMEDLLGKEQGDFTDSFKKEEQERMNDFKQELLTKSESFNREYASRVYVALQDIELEFHAIRNAYFKAIKFPIYLSCDHPTRTLDDSLEMARMVEILTGKPVEAAHDEIDLKYTACRIQANVESIVMHYLEKNILTV